MSRQSQIYSRFHTATPENFDTVLLTARDRINNQKGKSQQEINYELGLLSQLGLFALGRHLLSNRGLNGYWTDYILMHPQRSKKARKNTYNNPLPELELFLLDKAPTFLATQQRFQIFLEENQKAVKNGAILASIPCGLFGELLYLNYNGIETITLAGLDNNLCALEGADKLSTQKGLNKFTQLEEKDIWDFSVKNKFDLISSNGLNIYLAHDSEVIRLYRKFHKALKTGGVLVTSFLTPPPHLSKQEACEWDFTKINPDDFAKQKTIMADIIGTGWRNYRSTEETKSQLIAAGFHKDHIRVRYDNARMFPTVIAKKGNKEIHQEEKNRIISSL